MRPSKSIASAWKRGAGDGQQKSPLPPLNLHVGRPAVTIPVGLASVGSPAGFPTLTHRGQPLIREPLGGVVTGPALTAPPRGRRGRYKRRRSPSPRSRSRSRERRRPSGEDGRGRRVGQDPRTHPSRRSRVQPVQQIHHQSPQPPPLSVGEHDVINRAQVYQSAQRDLIAQIASSLGVQSDASLATDAMIQSLGSQVAESAMELLKQRKGNHAPQQGGDDRS